MRFLRRGLGPSDVGVIGDVPTTTADRTVADLVAYGEDLSLASNVLCDALGPGSSPTRRRWPSG